VAIQGPYRPQSKQWFSHHRPRFNSLSEQRRYWSSHPGQMFGAQQLKLTESFLRAHGSKSSVDNGR